MDDGGASRGALRACLLLAAGALAAGAALVARGSFVAGPDAFHYTDVARQMARGLGPVTYHLHLGMPAVPSTPGFWPLLFPAVVSVPVRLGIAPATAAGLVNAACVPILAGLLYLIARRALAAGWALPAALVATVQYGVYQQFFDAFSEPLFLVFTYGSLLLALDLWSDRAPGAIRSAALGALVGASFATRYAGLLLAGYVGIIAIVAAARHRWSVVALVRDAAWGGMAFVAASLPAILPNLGAYGSPFGMPRLPVASLGATAVARAGELWNSGSRGLAFALATTALVFLVPSLPSSLRGGRPPPVSPATDRARVTSIVLWTWSVFYAAALFVTFLPHHRVEGFNARFVGPAMPAVALCLAIGLARWRILADPRPRACVARSLAAALLLVALFTWRVSAQRRAIASWAAADGPLVSWALPRVHPGALFVGDDLWSLRQRTDATVLHDGYPEMPVLTPDRVGAFLRLHGEAFDTVYVVLRPGENASPEQADGYARALRDAGFRSGPPDTLESGVTVLSARRDAPGSRPPPPQRQP
jgi:hypothetical protein